MSKAFTREDDSGAGEVVPDDALPPGTRNYVTSAGLARLQEALRAASGAADPAASPANERRRRVLLRRLEAAEVVDPAKQPRDVVRFGATVHLRTEAGAARRYRIVGIDDADLTRGWVSWRSPIAVAMINARVGDAVLLRTPRGEEELEVVDIDYADA